MSSSSERVRFGLRVRLAVAFGLFVLVGSSVLIGWVHLASRAEALQRFGEIARVNAAFVRDARLPETARTAEALSRVLGIEVLFTGMEDAPALDSLNDSQTAADLFQRSARVVGTPVRVRGWEAVLVPVRDAVRMWFVRRAEPGLTALLQPRTLFALGAFWLLALGLAAVLGRGMIAPLRSLAERLPHIQEDDTADLPESGRKDEIGQLARAYAATRRQLRDERERREKAERLALLGRMATGLAHEIHNPVSAIRMHAQLLQSASPTDLPATTRETLPVLLSETARIESLVNQWMFLARPEPPRTSRVDLAPLVESAVAALRPAAEHAGVAFAVRTGPGLQVEGDARRLAQAISNVILNALQAMTDGGTLTIESLREQAAVLLVFRDEGAGFSPAALAKHADLFFSEKEGGMGMGLSVTHEILKAHGGELRVANAMPRGAIVTFRLPAI